MIRPVILILLRFAYPIAYFYACYRNANRFWLPDSKKYHWMTEEAYKPKLDPYNAVVCFLFIFVLAMNPFYHDSLPLYRSGALVGLLNFSLLLCCYYPLLLLTLPLLRRWFTAETCASLWSLPLFLALPVVCGDSSLPDHPWLVLRVSRQLPAFLFLVWAAGFLGIMGWRLLSHLLYRRRLLASAEEAPTWAQKLQYDAACAMGVDRKVPLLISPAAEGPLSIGVLKRKLRIVLPPRDYSEEALRLILRHEMIHLVRGDNRTKLFMTVLRALFWFLPPVWLGLRQAAEDVELNCDELAAAPLTETERQQYAGLLLEKAPPATGFTTCLSASAKGLRYRMSRILHPQKRFRGYVPIVLLAALFLGLYGRFCLAFPAGSIREAVLGNHNYQPEVASLAEDYTLEQSSSFYRCYTWRECTEPEALMSYLDSFTLFQEQQGYENSISRADPPDDLILVLMDLDGSALETDLQFRGDRLYVLTPGPRGMHYTYTVYLLSEWPDYDYIRSLLGEPESKT